MRHYHKNTGTPTCPHLQCYFYLFYNSMGAAHPKCWSKYAFLMFFNGYIKFAPKQIAGFVFYSQIYLESCFYLWKHEKNFIFWGNKILDQLSRADLKNPFFPEFYYKFLAFFPNFSAFCHSKRVKWRFQTGFGVRSTQALVETYNIHSPVITGAYLLLIDKKSASINYGGDLKSGHVWSSNGQI